MIGCFVLPPAANSSVLEPCHSSASACRSSHPRSREHRETSRQGQVLHRPVHVGWAGAPGHLGPEARCARGVSRRLQVHRDDHPRLPRLRTPAAPEPADRQARDPAFGDASRRRTTSRPRTGCSQASRRQPEGSPRNDDWPSYGAVLAKLGRGKGPLPPFVSMMPVVPERRAAVRRVDARPGRRLAGPALSPDADRRRRQQARLPRRRVRPARRCAGVAHRRPPGAAAQLDQQGADWNSTARCAGDAERITNAPSRFLSSPEVTRASTCRASRARCANATA